MKLILKNGVVVDGLPEECSLFLAKFHYKENAVNSTIKRVANKRKRNGKCVICGEELGEKHSVICGNLLCKKTRLRLQAKKYYWKNRETIRAKANGKIRIPVIHTI